MASLIRTMERKTVDIATLRARMEERGITVTRLADLAGLPRAHVSAILCGKQYLGARRGKLVLDAAVQLGLGDAADV